MVLRATQYVHINAKFFVGGRSKHPHGPQYATEYAAGYAQGVLDGKAGLPEFWPTAQDAYAVGYRAGLAFGGRQRHAHAEVDARSVNLNLLGEEELLDA